MRLLSFRFALRILAVLTLAAATGHAAQAQEFTGKVTAVPATNATPVISAKTIQEDALHRVGLPMHEVSELSSAEDLGPAPGDLRMALLLELQRSPRSSRHWMHS